MRIGHKQLLVFLAIGCARIGLAGTLSYTGAFDIPENVFEPTVTLASAGTLTLQTWGFGGGINGNLAAIPAGGFDPLVAVFMGAGPTATFIEGASDILFPNYSAFMGCPPAGTVTIGSIPGNCGDVLMALSLSAGTYTILLTDGANIPFAVNGGTLGDGFFDLTGGAFQTCLADGSACIADTGNWALDVSVSSPSPEPAVWEMACLGLLSLSVVARFRLGDGNSDHKRKVRGGVQL
jgi:hypothetical protein